MIGCTYVYLHTFVTVSVLSQFWAGLDMFTHRGKTSGKCCFLANLLQTTAWLRLSVFNPSIII